MSDISKPCNACGAEVKLGLLDMFRGTEGPVTVSVNAMPALICSNGHKRFVYPEFVSQLMDFTADAAMATPQPAAVRHGLFKKHYHCSGCDTELPAAPTGKSEREHVVRFEKAAPFKLMLQVDLYKCPQCAREQVLSGELAGTSAFKAIAHAFHAADVHLPG